MRGDQAADRRPAAISSAAAAARKPYVTSVFPGLRPSREPSFEYAASVTSRRARRRTGRRCGSRSPQRLRVRRHRHPASLAETAGESLRRPAETELQRPVRRPERDRVHRDPRDARTIAPFERQQLTASLRAVGQEEDRDEPVRPTATAPRSPTQDCRYRRRPPPARAAPPRRAHRRSRCRRSSGTTAACRAPSRTRL